MKISNYLKISKTNELFSYFVFHSHFKQWIMEKIRIEPGICSDICWWEPEAIAKDHWTCSRFFIFDCLVFVWMHLRLEPHWNVSRQLHIGILFWFYCQTAIKWIFAEFQMNSILLPIFINCFSRIATSQLSRTTWNHTLQMLSLEAKCWTKSECVVFSLFGKRWSLFKCCSSGMDIRNEYPRLSKSTTRQKIIELPRCAWNELKKKSMSIALLWSFCNVFVLFKWKNVHN